MSDYRRVATASLGGLVVEVWRDMRFPRCVMRQGRYVAIQRFARNEGRAPDSADPRHRTPFAALRAHFGDAIADAAIERAPGAPLSPAELA